MFFVFSVASLITVIIAVLLGIYLVSLMSNLNLVRFSLLSVMSQRPSNVTSLSVVAYLRLVIGVCVPRVKEYEIRA